MANTGRGTAGATGATGPAGPTGPTGPAGASGVSGILPFRSLSVYTSSDITWQTPTAGNGGVQPTPDTLIAYPIIVPNVVNATALLIFQVAQAGGAGNFAMGLYDDAVAVGIHQSFPGTLIDMTATISSNAGGANVWRSGAITGISIPAGIYWLAFNHDSGFRNTIMMSQITGATNQQTGRLNNGYDPATTPFKAQVGWQKALTFANPFPSTFPSAGTTPIFAGTNNTVHALRIST